MEEELNENELEERLYSMLHYVDHSQMNVNANEDASRIVENTPRSTVKRYWRTSGDQQAPNNGHNPYQKVNKPKDPPNKPQDKPKPKEEKREPPPQLSANLSIFQSPMPKNLMKTIEIIENENDICAVELETSDEDEVIEVVLPPKPTITIESSDEEEPVIQKKVKKDTAKPTKSSSSSNDREVSASPVPSVVSSVSDDFIRGDCIALNISSREPYNHDFDFSLHGAELLGQSTPAKKKKKKKNKDSVIVTTVAEISPDKPSTNSTEECFATPKSKAKNKKQKTKSCSVFEKSVPSVDLYDSDSNQSIITNKIRNPYAVSDKSFPSIDVYESDSNQSETTGIQVSSDKTKKSTEECFATLKSKANKKQKKSFDVHDSDSNRSDFTNKIRNPFAASENNVSSINVSKPDSIKDITSKSATQNNDIDSSDSSMSIEKSNNQTQKNSDPNNSSNQGKDPITIDLTDNSLVYDNPDICENIVMGNVTGFMESEDYEDTPMPVSEVTKFCSTKVPSILFENLDFDNLKGKDKVCKNRKYSLTTLRAEMEKFYNESWGGEDFNHREIQKSMSRDKSLWAIDPKDRIPALASRRRITCHYCNRPGHRDTVCRDKPLVCYMCGADGHTEPRCPRKICVNCGSPNHMYSTMCRNCCNWGRIICQECGQNGHPASHCPDKWRRYHNTIDFAHQLDENRFKKQHNQAFCSGCSRRGHFVHTCRLSLPFSGLPINSPFVCWYRPVYPPIHDNNTQHMNTSTPKNARQHRKSFSQNFAVSETAPINKRMSKSPTVHDSHMNKRRNISMSEPTESPPAPPRHVKSPINNTPQRKISQNADNNGEPSSIQDKNVGVNAEVNDPNIAADFIPIGSANRDKRGQMIQDNEVSDTSDVVTSARIYVTNEITDKLKSKDGEEWLKETMAKHDVVVQNSDVHSFLIIKGSFADQEAFQAALRDWVKPKPQKEHATSDTEADISKQSEQSFSEDLSAYNIPKNRNTALRKISTALQLLKGDLGDPKSIYKELNYLQSQHEQLLKQKVISPQRLSNNRGHMNEMMKKLNMVLLGQAGLADGSQHLKELYTLQEKLVNARQKTISVSLRKEIGDHFHCIFTAMPRDDYGELLKSYYTFNKKKKEKSFITSPKKKTFNAIPPQPIRNPGKEVKGGTNTGVVHIQNENPACGGVPPYKFMMNKMIFIHRRLMNSWPNDSRLKKTRMELVRKLHTHIATMKNCVSKNTTLPSKTLKKIRKVQNHAQAFMNNV